MRYITRYTLGPKVTAPVWEFGGASVRIAEDLRHCVVFFGVPSAGKDNEIEYGGTGFLVAHHIDGESIPYLVTNRHVADGLAGYKDTGFVVRANTRDGKSEPIPFDAINWFYHPDKTVDLAATFFLLGEDGFDVKYYLMDSPGPNSSNYAVCCGDPISIVGLFRLHAGKERNLPIVHTGNVALLPDPANKVPFRSQRRNEQPIDREVYLVEVQTLEGLSGSPVFIRRIGFAHQYKTQKGQPPIWFSDMDFLGVYAGAWDGRPGEILAADRDLAGHLRVPVGMGGVVPSEKLWELLTNHLEAKHIREEYVNQKRQNVGMNQDTAFPPSSNPVHKEDFTRLVSVAAKKKPQGD
jgi:hypothetical protein